MKGTNICPKETVRFISVGDGSKWGVMNLKEKEILPIAFEDINFTFLNYGYIAAKSAGKFGLFDLEGKMVSDFIFDQFIPGIFCGGKGEDLCGSSTREYFLIKPDGSLLPAPERPKIQVGPALGRKPAEVPLSDEIRKIMLALAKFSPEKFDAVEFDILPSLANTTKFHLKKKLKYQANGCFVYSR